MVGTSNKSVPEIPIENKNNLCGKLDTTPKPHPTTKYIEDYFHYTTITLYYIHNITIACELTMAIIKLYNILYYVLEFQ